MTIVDSATQHEHAVGRSHAGTSQISNPLNLSDGDVAILRRSEKWSSKGNGKAHLE